MKFFIVATVICGLACAKSEFSIMAYNVENLFDNHDDFDREDETYLPRGLKGTPAHKSKCKKLSNFKFRKDCYRLDWNQGTLSAKMKNLSEVILSVDQGRGPDILILTEVENTSILKVFSEKFLASAKYKTVELIEGEDPRGIDIAILSRFPKSDSAKLIDLKLENPKTGKKMRTRGILRLPLQLSKNKFLSVFAVHFPSQGSPISTRLNAIQSLNRILESEKKAWIVGGDFNITKKEEDDSELISKHLARRGDVSHLIGCQDSPGTHFYKNKWSFLDLLYFDSRLPNQGIQVITDSIKVIRHSQFMGKKGSPLRFVPDKGQGASDHFPIYARLKF